MLPSLGKMPTRFGPALHLPVQPFHRVVGVDIDPVSRRETDGASTSSRSAWARTYRSKAATLPAQFRGTQAGKFRVTCTRQGCQSATSTWAEAAFSPAWLSEITNWTSDRPRATSVRRNSTQCSLASEKAYPEAQDFAFDLGFYNSRLAFITEVSSTFGI